MILTTDDIVERISNVLEDMDEEDGDSVADAVNKLLGTSIVYLGGGKFEEPD